MSNMLTIAVTAISLSRIRRLIRLLRSTCFWGKCLIISISRKGRGRDMQVGMGRYMDGDRDNGARVIGRHDDNGVVRFDEVFL